MPNTLTKPCILQTKGLRKDGYAYDYDKTIQDTMLAHRRAYLKAHPDENIVGRSVLHRCAARNCIEPEHLYLAPLRGEEPTENELDILGALDLLKWSK